MKNKIYNLKNNRLIKNIAYIFSGASISSIVTLFNTALLVKAIGLKNNGILYLAIAYAEFFNALFNFQSYEAIIKFLPKYMSFGNKKGKNYIQQAIILDIVTAVISFIVAFTLIDIIIKYFKWDTDIKLFIKITTISILFNLTGAFNGVLRIFEKFKYISTITIINSLINSLIYSFGILTGATLKYYVFGVVISSGLSLFQTIIFTYKTLKINGMNDLNLFKTKFDKEFIRFTIYTNLSTTLDIPIFHLTPFILNRYLGYLQIGIYKILEKLGGIIGKIGSIISQAMIPEFSKKIAENNKQDAYKLGIKIGKIMLLFGILGLIIFTITYKIWLQYFIPNYQPYLMTIYFYLMYIIFTQIFMAQHPIFIYSGYVKENAILLGFINIFYIGILILFTKLYGLNGMILSKFIQASMVFLIKWIIMRKNT